MMADARSNRKSKVVAFIRQNKLSPDANVEALVRLARSLKMEGFERVEWLDSRWTITGGRLTKLTGKNSNKADFYFSYSPSLGGEELTSEWAEVCKALFLLRFHRKYQAAPNQRGFIVAVGYVAYAAHNLSLGLSTLTPEALNQACRLISNHYSEGTAYNYHKAIAEFAAHCDHNGLCLNRLAYKYAGMRRPDSTGGLQSIRLDDPQVLETKSDKMVDPLVYKIIGELYQNVPKNHKYRFYVLVLTLLCCLARRFSEISLLLNQKIQTDVDGRQYLEYFPRKGHGAKGDVFTPRRKLYMPTQVLQIVEDTVLELSTLCQPARDTAAEMLRTNDVDLRFLSALPDDQKLYKDDLEALGITPTILTMGWPRKHGLTFSDLDRLDVKEKKPRHPIRYIYKAGVVEYCRRNFSESLLQPLHVDQKGKKFYLKDLLLVRHVGLSTGAYTHWAASQCTHSMMATFMRYFSDLAREFASSSIGVDFTSHHFRHTVNTLLDEGGLSDLLQTEWFGRSNPRDTKAYQHTSREKRALMLRESIKANRAGGKVVDQLKYIPIEASDAFLSARVRAVHDVGPGMCIHNFAQTPCQRHLQCLAECDDYVWAKNDDERLEDLKRQYAMTVLARETAEVRSKTGKPGKSGDWIVHNDKKLKVLRQQLKDNGISDFDPQAYIQGINDA